MGKWIRTHWLAICGFLGFVPPLFKGIFWLISRGGDADFIISRFEELGWVGDVMEFIVNPPNWVVFPAIIVGLSLIWWDAKRPNRRAASIAQDEDSGKPIYLFPYIHAESYRVINDEGQPEAFYANHYYLAVSNGLQSGQTLRRVKANLMLTLPPVALRLKDAPAQIVTDIQHGEVALFELGRLVTAMPKGTYSGDRQIPNSSIRVWKHNIPNGYLNFDLPKEDGSSKLSFSDTPDYIWELLVVVSADDVESARVIIKLDMKADDPVSIKFNSSDPNSDKTLDKENGGEAAAS